MAADLSGAGRDQGAAVAGGGTAGTGSAAGGGTAGTGPAAGELPGTGVVPFGVAGAPGAPTLRWAGHATTVDGITRELGRIWIRHESPPGDGAAGRAAAPRTRVLNLVVVARSPEVGEQAASTLAMGTGRHPSRTLIVVPTDPDGPAWLRADVRAYGMVPRAGAPETCAEHVYVTAGGGAGRHLEAIVAPLLVPDLPVTVWLPGDPSFGSALTAELTETADRLVVDGSRWSGNGLDRLRALAALVRPDLPVSDFALMRQARWREAVASVFDRADLLPFLRSMRRITVAYATSGGPGAESATNLVKPIYHVAWLASRLGLRVARPLAIVEAAEEDDGLARTDGAGAPDPGRGMRALLESERGRAVDVSIQPEISEMPGGTTLLVELAAERRGSELRTEVTAGVERVRVRAVRDGVVAVDRTMHALRRTDVDLLAEAIEASGRDRLAEAALSMAARLAGPGASA